jgi:hypothetical protein
MVILQQNAQDESIKYKVKNEKKMYEVQNLHERKISLCFITIL